ncbi:MAG: hypothetical protein FJY17_02745 [Bacteroidetes bacterium]|nr:hypothetical protein [Bacteroidota bacterium]
MSNFIRRLKYYGIGFGLGVIIVFFFFGSRGCNWGPTARVKTSILERVLIVDSTNKVELKRRGVHPAELRKLIEDSDVDFSESKKEKALKVYSFHNDKFNFLVSMPYESFIAEVNILKQDAYQFTTSLKGKGFFMHFPKDKDFLFVPENELLRGQMKDMGFKDNNALFEAIKRKGFIDFSSSNFNVRPKSEHSIGFIDNKKRNIKAKAIWMKERIEVLSFTFDTISPRK